MKTAILLIITTFLSATPLPQSHFILDKKGFVVGFDGRTRNASWVYEKLNCDSLEKKKIKRSHYLFTQDLSIPDPFRAKNEDFQNSGFDRGHLCPFADLPDSCAGESFLLSNICPQSPSMNRGTWNQLENHVRSLISKYKELHIITLPLYLPETEKDGKRYVHYQVLGETGVAVPTHFAKAIFAQRDGTIEVFVYLLPDRTIERNATLDSFKTSLEHVEKISGVFFPELESFFSID
jgi:endonuclease G